MLRIVMTCALALLAVSALTGVAAADGDAGADSVDELFAAPPEQPQEAGIVPWRRDWDAAVEEAKTTGKPLFVQFQELPG